MDEQQTQKDPERGGRYLRDAETGELVRLEEDAPPTEPQTEEQ